MAYDRLDPIGGVRGDYHAAMVATMIANVNRDSQKRPEPFEVSDFMPRFGEAVAASDKEEQGTDPKALINFLDGFAKVSERRSRVVKKKENGRGSEV